MRRLPFTYVKYHNKVSSLVPFYIYLPQFAVRLSEILNTRVVEGFCCQDFFQPFIENAIGTVIMSYISQGRLPLHNPRECGYSHRFCWLDCFIRAMDTVVWIVLFALSELEQNIIFVSSNPKITVICFSS